MMKSLVTLAALAVMLLTFAFHSHATSHVWTGLGGNSYWSTAANWSSNNKPAAGEAAPVTVVFPAGVPRGTNTNDIANLTIDALFYYASNCVLQGSGAGTNITFRDQSTSYGGYGVNNVLGATLNITLSGSPRFALDGSMRILGRLMGTGGFKLYGSGVLTLNGVQSNSYSGATEVYDGTLSLNGGYLLFNSWVSSVSVSGPLIIGDTNMNQSPNVLLIHGDQIADSSSVTMGPSGYLYMGGNDEAIGSLTMTGGSLYGDSLETSLIGTLTLGGNVSAPFTPLINGVITANVNLDGVTRTIDVPGGMFVMSGVIDDGSAGRAPAGITKTGTGKLRLGAATNTYNGITTVNGGTLEVIGSRGLGLTNAGTTINSNATLLLTSISLAAEPFTLIGGAANNVTSIVANGTCILPGVVTLRNTVLVSTRTASDWLVFDNLVTGTGGALKEGLGTLLLSGPVNNTFAGTMTVRNGTLLLDCGVFVAPNFIPSLALSGPLVIGTGSTTAQAALWDNGQLPPGGSVFVGTNGTLNLAGYSTICGPLTLDNGQVTTGVGTLTLNGDITVQPSSVSTINGIVSLGNSTRTILCNANSGVDIEARITGNAGAGITKTGPGWLVLSASNSFSGPTVLNGGTITAYSGNSFGTGAGGVTVNPGTHIYLYSEPPFFPRFTVANTVLTLNGHGTDGLGAIKCYGSNIWAGPVVLASDSSISTVATISGDKFVLGGAVSGPGGLSVRGIDSAVLLAGTDDNTFTGLLNVMGTNSLYLGKTAGATAVPGPFLIGDANSPYGKTYVHLNAPNQIANSVNVNFENSGVLDMNGFNETVGGLTFHSGVITGVGTLTLSGNVTNYGPGVANVYPQFLSLGGAQRTFTSFNTLSIITTIIDGGASAGITTEGYGYVYLSRSNAYTGPTIVNDGELIVEHSKALGSTGAGTIVNTNGRLALHDVTVFSEPLTMNSSRVGALEPDGTNLWSGPITLSRDMSVRSFAVSDMLTLSGVISGEGGVTQEGEGRLIFAGPTANTYTASTTVRRGTLELNKVPGVTAVPANLFIGTENDPPLSTEVRLYSDEQIGWFAFSSYVQVNRSGLLYLNGHNQTIQNLSLNDDAWVFSGPTGLLNLLGGISVQSPNGGYGQLSGRVSLSGDRPFSIADNAYLKCDASILDGVGSGGIVVNGPGAMELSGSNSFSGPVVLNGSVLLLLNDFALGKTNGGTFVTNSATLSPYNVRITGEPLTISNPGWNNGSGVPLYNTGTNVWGGPITLAGDTSINLQGTDSVFVVSGPISGPGELNLFGQGKAQFIGTAPNTFTGKLQSWAALVELAKTNAVAVYGGLDVFGGIVRCRSANQILDSSPVTVQSPGVFDLNSFTDIIGDLNGSGSVQLGGGVLSIASGSPTNVFSGVISGVGGGIEKIGGNTLVLTGTNTYNSGTLVKGGALLVNGSLASDTYVYPGATLGGTGAVGNLYGLGGTISPGASPGKLSCGTLTLNSGTMLAMELRGTNGGVSYDQLNVTGGVTIGSPVTLKISKPFAGSVGNQYMLVANDAADAITGRFTGLTENAVFAADGTQLRISYQGGTGNDIVLTQLTLPPPVAFSSITMTNGAAKLSGSGISNFVYRVEANVNLNTTNWLNLGDVSADALGAILFTDLQATNFPQRFYRFLLP